MTKHKKQDSSGTGHSILNPIMVDYLDVPQLAEYLNVSNSLVYRWSRDGALTKYYFGKKLLFKKSDVAKFIESRLQKSMSKAEVEEEARKRWT